MHQGDTTPAKNADLTIDVTGAMVKPRLTLSPKIQEYEVYNMTGNATVKQWSASYTLLPGSWDLEYLSGTTKCKVGDVVSSIETKTMEGTMAVDVQLVDHRQQS